MAWVLGIIIFLAMGAFVVLQYRQSMEDADRFDLSRKPPHDKSD